MDLTEPTAPGTIISIAAALLMISLFCGELYSYFSPRIQSDMFVGQDASSTERLKVNLNMSFHRVPCFALSLDVLDVLGRHEVGVDRTVRHIRLGRDGANLGPFEDRHHDFPSQSQEGCRAEGHVMVNKVPGNFHVSSHGKQQLVAQFMGGQLNVQHTIHHLWFGEVEFHGAHDYEGQVHPLNGMSNIDVNMHYEYFLDIVPTTYKRGSKLEAGYQFTANMHKQEVPPGHMAAAFFRYQLSPITVQFGPEKTSFLHFLTYVCAIIGGVFTVAGMLSRSIHTTAVQFQKRVLGKDS